VRGEDGRVQDPPVQDSQGEGEVRVPCEVYSRIVGYIRPVQNWHQAKQQEFDDRKEFDVSGLLDEKEKRDD
jgi:hypothetical protein